MEVKIRMGQEDDMKAVLGMIEELAEFEKALDQVKVTKEDLVNDGFRNRCFTVLIAETEKEIVGMALFYPRYSSWKGPTIHLEDLIVTNSKRGLNIGSALYQKIIEYGYKKGVRRIEWAVLDWNTPAIEFYEKTGAKILRDWDIAQIDRASMKKYLEI